MSPTDAEGDSNGDHGTHVAGIAAANRYVPHYDADGDLYYDKQELGVTGVAPDAQLVVMRSSAWAAARILPTIWPPSKTPSG